MYNGFGRMVTHYSSQSRCTAVEWHTNGRGCGVTHSEGGICECGALCVCSDSDAEGNFVRNIRNPSPRDMLYK